MLSVTQGTGDSSPSRQSRHATYDSPKDTARMSAPNDVALGI